MRFIILLLCLTPIFMLGMARAQTLTLEPSTISIQAYPGESITKNITIRTDGNYAVYLRHSVKGNSSFANVSVNFPTPIIVEKNLTTPITFSFANDVTPQALKIVITAEAELAEVEVLVPPRTSSGGSSYFVPKKTTPIRLKEKPKVAAEPKASSENETIVLPDPDSKTLREAPIARFFKAIKNWFLNLFRGGRQ